MPLRSDFKINALTPSGPLVSGHPLEVETDLGAGAGFQTRTLIARNLKIDDSSRLDLESFEVTEIAPRRSSGDSWNGPASAV